MAELKPFVKWAGGKRKLAARITDQFSVGWTGGIPAYGEPFLGGGAVFLYMLRRDWANTYVICDANPEVVNLWRVVRDNPANLLEEYGRWENTEERFYAVRDHFEPQTMLERATYMLWLNRHCFNGLYRVNRSGKFNVPFGRYKKPRIDADNLHLVSAAIRANSVEILDPSDFVHTFNALETVEGACVYCDPPYWPMTETANFTAYTGQPFLAAEQNRLLKFARRWGEAGDSRQVIISNSAAEPVLFLYGASGHTLDLVEMPRALSSATSKRGPVKEVLLHIRGSK